MLITGLSYAVNGNEVDVYIDNGGTCRLLLDSIVKYKLHQGKVISEVDYADIIKIDSELRIFKKAIGYISIRPRTESELYNYLQKQKLISENENKNELVEDIISKLKSQNYINDNDFCQWLIENRVNCSLKSKLEVKSELLQKGVSSSIIATQLNKYYSEEEEQEVFDKIFEKKFSNLNTSDKKDKLKIFNYFQRRGFSFKTIREKINI
jgi:regulatory protein